MEKEVLEECYKYITTTTDIEEKLKYVKKARAILSVGKLFFVSKLFRSKSTSFFSFRHGILTCIEKNT